MQAQRIAVIMGGPSPEAEVSRRSAAAVGKALTASFPHIAVLELDSHLTGALRAFAPDVVFPALHGVPGEDGSIQGYLEMLDYAYVGSGVAASVCAINKPLAKLLFHARGLPLAGGLEIHRAEIDNGNTAETTARITATLGDRLVVKPATGGSALGVFLTDGAEELHAALASACATNERILVEERIEGAEITVGILEHQDKGRLEALPSIEIRTPEHSWYDYKHRYTEGLYTHIIPADVPKPAALRLTDIARAAHLALGCRDLSRADFILTSEYAPYLLEVNTMPGLTSTSLYPDAARAAGYDLQRLCALLVNHAWRRKLQGASGLGRMPGDVMGALDTANLQATNEGSRRMCRTADPTEEN